LAGSLVSRPIGWTGPDDVHVSVAQQPERCRLQWQIRAAASRVRYLPGFVASSAKLAFDVPFSFGDHRGGKGGAHNKGARRMTDLADRRLIRELDAYFDAAPRPDADAVETTAFTLFVSRTPWGYYARPFRTHDEPIAAPDIDELGQACAHHGVDLEIEWVHETHPELAGVAAEYGLEVKSHALMVADASDVVAPKVADVTLRVIDAEDSALLSGRAVAQVSFTVGGTMTGRGGVIERDAAAVGLPGDMLDYLRDRDRRGLTITAVAESEAGVLAVGSYQPIGEIAEIVAVATLPQVRRRGLGGAVTALLTRHAWTHGVRTILLSAQDDDVARVYSRVGFRRVGSTHAAHRPETS
jgi:GNAT superfamily N-acetyltransferase